MSLLCCGCIQFASQTMLSHWAPIDEAISFTTDNHFRSSHRGPSAFTEDDMLGTYWMSLNADAVLCTFRLTPFIAL